MKLNTFYLSEIYTRHKKSPIFTVTSKAKNKVKTWSKYQPEPLTFPIHEQAVKSILEIVTKKAVSTKRNSFLLFAGILFYRGETLPPPPVLPPLLPLLLLLGV